MWIFFTINLVLSCQLEVFEDCLGNGKRSTKCIRKSECIEQEIEIKVPSNMLLLKGFVVESEVKFEIGELIGCDLYSYELCFNLQPKDVVSCLRKIDCLDFIEISELREDYGNFNYPDFNQFNNRYSNDNNEETENPTKEEENPNNNDLFYAWKQIFEKQVGEMETEQDESEEIGQDESENFEIDEEFDEDGKDFEIGLFGNSDQNIDEDVQGRENEKVDHYVNEADTFFDDLWKIEQDVAKNEKEAEKKLAKNGLEDFTLQEIADKIEELYDEWEKAKMAEGAERVNYQWMMDEQGEVKELDVLLEDLYIAYRKKIHEKMEDQYKNKPDNDHDSATRQTNENNQKTHEKFSKEQEKAENFKENTKKNLNEPEKKVEETKSKQNKDDDYPTEVEIDLDIEESGEIPEDYEKETEIDEEFHSMLEEIAAFEKKFGIYKQKSDNNAGNEDKDFEENEHFDSDIEENDSLEYKLIGLMNDGDSGLEPNMNDEDFDFEKHGEFIEDEYQELENSEDDDQVSLKTIKKEEFLQTDEENSDSCEKSCERRCLKSENESCLSNCLTSMCFEGTSRTDYFTVIITGLFLFCVVSIIYLFMKNRNIRIGYENYIKGHTS